MPDSDFERERDCRLLVGAEQDLFLFASGSDGREITDYGEHAHVIELLDHHDMARVHAARERAKATAKWRTYGG